MSNHHPTKLWINKLVDCTIDQNRNDENIWKNQVIVLKNIDPRYEECVQGYMYLIIIFDNRSWFQQCSCERIQVHQSSISDKRSSIAKRRC